VNEAFELWNVSYFRIKATPRNFHGSFILNNSKLSTEFYATNRLLSLTTRKTEKWTPASTVMGGLCFHKMVYSALGICFKSFYRSWTCDIAFSFWKDGSTQWAGVVEVQLVVDVRSCQCHLTLKHSQFLENSLECDSPTCSNDSCTLGQWRELGIVTGEITLLIRWCDSSIWFLNVCCFRINKA